MLTATETAITCPGSFVADQGTGCYHCPGLRAQLLPGLIAQ